jgi:hypothetical protein
VRAAYRVDELLGKTSEAHKVPKCQGRVVPMVVRIIGLEARTESSHNPRKNTEEFLKQNSSSRPNTQRQQTGCAIREALKIPNRSPLVDTYQWKAKNLVISENLLDRHPHKMSEIDKKVSSFSTIRLERKTSAKRAPKILSP